MSFICGFMAEQISVCPCIKKFLIAFFCFFPYRQRYRTIRMSCFYLIYYKTDFVVRVIWIFTALKHKRAETQLISCVTALKYLFVTQTVPLCIMISMAYSTVITIIFTIICKFYKTADKYFIAIYAFRFFCRLISKIFYPINIF